MKTKQINRTILAIFMLYVMFVSVFAFTACKKDEYPKSLTVEQAKQIVNDAIEKAYSATNIHADYGDGEFAMANSDGYYEEYFTYNDIGGISTKCLIKEWRVYGNSSWSIISITYLENGEPVSYDIIENGSTATSYVEVLVSDLDWISDCFEDDTLNVTAKQLDKNTIKIIFNGEETSYEIEIVNGYITKTTETYVYEDGEVESWSSIYSYNVTDKEIPEIPNME